MNDPYESYKLYNALKLHFETDSYDALKYNFKTSIKPHSFFNRKDKYFFAKLAKTYGKNLKIRKIENILNKNKDIFFQNRSFKKIEIKKTFPESILEDKIFINKYFLN